MNDAIVVATSIAPKNIEGQKVAVASWLALGMHVLSVNCHAEAGDIAASFPEVDVVDVGDLDVRHTTRKLVYFDQLLAALRQSGGKICGIVNSDIHLRGEPDLAARVAQLGRKSLVFGARMDVSSLGDTAGEPYPHGFDFFFFDHSVIDTYPKSPFRLGAPWWDIWAPLVPLVRGIPITRLTDPIARHVRHDSAWSQEQEWQTYGALFMEEIYKLTDGGWAAARPTPGGGDMWASFCTILSDRLFAHHQLLSRSLPNQDPATQALIRATNDQIALVVGQSMRLLLERMVPAVEL
jgi:hypothetical protein